MATTERCRARARMQASACNAPHVGPEQALQQLLITGVLRCRRLVRGHEVAEAPHGAQHVGERVQHALICWRRREELLPQAGVPASLGGGLADRVVSRLLALGYERITFVTPPAELDAGRSELDIVVEARRDGAACKGRVLVRGGRIHDIQIQSAYAAFP
jgi:hypothetical protein